MDSREATFINDLYRIFIVDLSALNQLGKYSRDLYLYMALVSMFRHCFIDMFSDDLNNLTGTCIDSMQFMSCDMALKMCSTLVKLSVREKDFVMPFCTLESMTLDIHSQCLLGRCKLGFDMCFQIFLTQHCMLYSYFEIVFPQ